MRLDPARHCPRCRFAPAFLALALSAAPVLAAPPRPAAPPLQGVVTEVVDGSTLAFAMAGQAPLRLRLRDIEVPEACQPGADDARRALAERAQGKPALVQLSGRRDAQGRTLAAVRVDEADLSRRMVEDGFAWSTRSKWDRGPLVKQERMAEALHRGLHGHGGQLSPTEFRRRHGACPAAPRK
ncbi:thermonuclease family protein [Rubrivivax sp. A210]|uniref:thermonuclease family protein n=1 Tax=Rubrivivax sp. A210 TaxID=2772301 RepID=UPI0019197336|nr:thermonuclease family protein [Rubrivivax sp. A210]